MFGEKRAALLARSGTVCYDWRLWISVIVGLSLRLYHLDRNSLWFDEGFSVAFARADVPALLHKTLAMEPHPPTYYLILHYWIVAFGTSPTAIRMLSVIFGAATIFLVFKIGETLGDRRVGAVGSFLLAISPFHIQYSTEARMYALLTFAGALSVWGAALFMRNMTRPPPLRTASIVLVIGISLAIATHNAGLLLWAAITATLVIIWMVVGRPWPAFRYGLVFNGTIAILFFCWLPLLLRDWQVAQTATSWMPPLGLKVTAEELGRLFAPKILEALSYQSAAVAAAAVALIALLGAYSWRHDLCAALFCVLIGIFPIVLAAGISLVKPIFVARIFLPSLILLVLLIGAAIIASRPRFVQAGLIVVIALVNFIGLYGYYVCWNREDWQTAVITIARAMHAQDIVVVASPLDEIGNIIGYYAPQLASKLTFVGDDAAVHRLAEDASGRRVWQIHTAWHDQVSGASIELALDRDHTILRSISVNLVDVKLWSPRK
jgi:mannosyltransferase